MCQVGKVAKLGLSAAVAGTVPLCCWLPDAEGQLPGT